MHYLLHFIIVVVLGLVKTLAVVKNVSHLTTLVSCALLFPHTHCH